MSKTLRIGAVAMAILAALSACDGDGDDDVEVDGGSMEPSGMQNGGAPPRGPSVNIPKCEAPHAIGMWSVNGHCEFVCETGFMDCDGDPANGCEVSLAQPDPCAQCPKTAEALRCFHPELCKLQEPECTPTEGKVFTSRGDASESSVYSLAVGPSSDQVFAVSNRPFSGSLVTQPSPGAAVFSAKIAEGGGYVWQVPGGFLGGHVQRVGDRVYAQSASKEDSPSTRLIALSLDGKLIWQANVGMFEGSGLGGAFTVDGAGNVYATGSRDPMFTGGRMLVSLDATGKERWRSKISETLKEPCSVGRSALHDLRAAGDRLFGITEKCIIEFDPSSGAARAQAELPVKLQDGFLRSDASGALYLADSASSSEVPLVPDGAAADDPELSAILREARAIYVSKYTPDLKRQWTHVYASIGSYGESGISNPALLDFDVNAKGTGFLLGRGSVPFLVRIDAEGRATAADLITNELYPPDVVAAAENDTAFVAGDYKTLIRDIWTGMFVWNLAFDPGAPRPRSAMDDGMPMTSLDAGSIGGDANLADAGVAR